VFQLFSHKALYDDSSNDVKVSTLYPPRRSWKQRREHKAEKKAKKNGTWVEPPPETVDTHTDLEANSAEAEEDAEEKPKMSVMTTIGLLVIVTVVCHPCSLSEDELSFACRSWSLLLLNG
jgi:hypothetical protein